MDGLLDQTVRNAIPFLTSSKIDPAFSLSLYGNIQGLGGYLERRNPGYFGNEPGKRIGGFTGNALFLGNTCASTIPQALKRPLMSILPIYGLIRSETRGSLLGAILGLLATAYTSSLRQRIKALLLIGIILSFWRGKRKVTKVNQTNSIGTRKIFWRVAFQAIKDGYRGPYRGTWDKYFPKEIRDAGQAEWFIDKPHNYYLERLVEDGVLGLVAHLSRITASMYSLKGIEKNERARILGSLISIHISQGTSFPDVGTACVQGILEGRLLGKEVRSRFSWTFFTLGMIHFVKEYQKGKDTALWVRGESKTFDPRNVLYFQGSILREILDNQQEERLKQIEEALKNDKSVDGLVALAELYLLTGRDGLRYAEEAYKLAPKHPAVIACFAEIRKDKRLAEELFRDYPDWGTSLFVYGVVHEDGNYILQALEERRAGKVYKPRSVYDIAIIAECTNRKEVLRDCWKAVKGLPDSKEKTRIKNACFLNGMLEVFT